MKRFQFITLLLAVLLLPHLLIANPPFKAGINYKAITPPADFAKQIEDSPKVSVIEFFSYGCPACYALEPHLEKWLAEHGDHVEFKRVPVIFESGWDNLAKAYYTAVALDKQATLSPALFAAIHQDHQDLTQVNQIEKVFAAHGIDKDTFNSTFNFSPGIDAQIAHALQMRADFRVIQVPSVIINGKYLVTPQTAGSFEAMPEVISYLVAKESASHPHE